MAIQDLIPWKKKEVSSAATRENDPFELLRTEVNRLFDGVFSNAWPGNRHGGGKFMPEVEVIEDDHELRVTAELPGMDEKDVNITVADGMLTIQGEKRQERKEEENGYYYSERSYGAFYRSLPLSDDFDPDKAKATFKKGVLTLVVPRNPEAKRKRQKIAIATD